ncbi:MAG: hypothetical protein IRZ13_00345 [Acetobacteraceae bacterium]|nr:hypothetical protein [Acetobacteraceae bacterium]
MDWVPLGTFAVCPIPGGEPRHEPRLLPALLMDACANGIFSVRRIERTTYRDLGVQYVAANLRPDHDTIAPSAAPTASPSRRPACWCC